MFSQAFAVQGLQSGRGSVWVNFCVKCVWCELKAHFMDIQLSQHQFAEKTIISH
jgi:hypothetical protein